MNGWQQDERGRLWRGTADGVQILDAAYLNSLEAYKALADEAEDYLMDRLDAYPEDWSLMFAEEIRAWRARYDALKEQSN